MTVDTLIFSDEADAKPSFTEDGMDDVDFGDFDDDAASDTSAVDPSYKPDDDEFQLDGYASLGRGKVDDEGSPAPIAQQRAPKHVHDFTDSRRKRIKTEEVDTFILHDVEPLSNNKSSRIPGTFGRSDRKDGVNMRLPAYHKRVTHNLDSDDELIMEMRDKNFTDRQIAEKLVKEGRSRYDHKSITTRVARIRRAQAENVDLLIKDGCREWEYEEDCLLMKAIALADAEIESEVKRIHSKRFFKVSDHLRDFSKDAIFSENACRERYSAIMDGTATIPTELADDPEARRAELEAYRQSREKVRTKEQMETDIKEARERKDKNEIRILNAQKAEETANKRAQMEAEKAERAMKRAAAAQVRAQRALENANAQNQRNAQFKKQKQAIADAKKSPQSPARQSTALAQPKTITANTTDPRSKLSLPDLSKMAAARGINVVSKTKAELIRALKDADDEWSATDLKKMCRSKGLGTTGSNLQMKYQLAMKAAKACPSYGSGSGAESTKGDEERDGDEFMVDAE